MNSHERAVQYRRYLIDQFESPEEEVELLDDVLNGKLHLIELEMVTEEMERAPEDSYAGVYGSFCRLNFAVHKANPSSGTSNSRFGRKLSFQRCSLLLILFFFALWHRVLFLFVLFPFAVPMFRDIVAKSPECEDPFELDLKKIVYLARQRDEQVQLSGTEVVPKVLNLTAVAFHESRCGSTLVANAMIAMDPVKHRTYSESAPPASVLRNICGDNFSICSEEQAAIILRDTIYMMSRTDDPLEERVFFKFQSVTSKSINVFQMAFPDVPWMYVYRDPVQVMMSHVKDDPKLKHAVCTRSMHGRPQADLMGIAKRHGRHLQDFERVEYCAAHLATLTESAVANLNDMAIPVNYDKLPDMLWKSIMPKIFGRPLTQKEIDRMEEVSHDYSKGRGKMAGEFHGDSKQKEKAASEEVRMAAKAFLQESYDKLNNFQPMLLK